MKVAAADTLVVEGSSISDTFMPALDAGWNLIGYSPQEGEAPESFFSEMIAEENLLYVTGFDEGVLVYDPNGLPFLQTLLEMQNSFGYWVKTVNGTQGEVLMPELENSSKFDRHAGSPGYESIKVAAVYPYCANPCAGTVPICSQLPSPTEITTSLPKSKSLQIE